MEAVTYVTVGAIAGVVTFHVIGGAGLAIGGTAYPIGVGSFAVLGATAGLAVYGAKKSVFNF
jgi:hypothetical protein